MKLSWSFPQFVVLQENNVLIYSNLLLLLFPCIASAGSRRFFHRGRSDMVQSEEGYVVMNGTSDSKELTTDKKLSNPDKVFLSSIYW
jgi:hypothetical protein